MRRRDALFDAYRALLDGDLGITTALQPDEWWARAWRCSVHGNAMLALATGEPWARVISLPYCAAVDLLDVAVCFDANRCVGPGGEALIHYVGRVVGVGSPWDAMDRYAVISGGHREPDMNWYAADAMRALFPPIGASHAHALAARIHQGRVANDVHVYGASMQMAVAW